MAAEPAVRVPLGPKAVKEWFDPDGRLVKESVMRKALFEVGVEPSCRRELFKFLYGIYPMNSTTRDRKTIDIENRANYIALRRRWEVMDRTITFPEDELAQEDPWYMELSDIDETDSNSAPSTDDYPESNASSAISQRRSEVVGLEDGSLTTRQGLENLTRASLTTDGNTSCVTDTCSSCGGGLQRGREEAQPPGGESMCISNGSAPDDSQGCEHCPNGDCADSELLSGMGGEQCQNEEGANSTGGSTGETLLSKDVKQCQNGGSTDPPKTLGDHKGVSDCGCGWRTRRRSTSGVLDSEGQALLEILDFPAKVYAARISVDLEKSYPRAKRIILRDVSRTDRNYHFFSHKKNLRKVHRILMIYSLFNPEIGYAQGMNDILARFLVITGSEVDSYWLFKRYMDSKREDFLESTMMSKVGLVKMLISEMDSKLYNFFKRSECQDYLFCHRWLLLDFKREFPFDESIRLFEVLSSHYLELNSDKARVETDKVIAKEFELDGGEMRATRSSVNLGFTFDLFVCAAILTMNSDVITQGTDAASVYGCMNELSNNMDLNAILSTAEQLFYKYCKLTVTRGFSQIEL